MADDSIPRYRRYLLDVLGGGSFIAGVALEVSGRPGIVLLTAGAAMLGIQLVAPVGRP